MLRSPKRMKKQILALDVPAPIALHIPDFHRVALTLVGCGGTGSHIASGLVSIGQALGERGIALDVLLVDPDVVEHKNVGRQLFARADVGRPKAQVIAERLNMAFGCTVGAAVRAIDSLDEFVRGAHDLNVVIGAVDNVSARALIAKAVEQARGGLWWIDAGNENHSGQVAIGNIANAKDLKGSVALGLIDRLPTPHLVYPDLIRKAKTKRAPRGRHVPSCAELAAAGEQSLMINRVMAAYTCSMLTDFLVTRDLRYFAVAVDLRWAGTRAYTLDLPTLAEACGLREDQLVAKARR